MIAKADADIKAQLSPDDPSVAELDKRYPKAVAHTSLGGAATPTEQDAWWPICKCLARPSISSCSTKRPIGAEIGEQDGA